MIKHERIPLESPSEWKEALGGIRHSFGHTWEHCYAMHLTTGLKTYLYCFESSGARVVCPIMEREYNEYKDITKPFGFSGFVGNADCPEFSQHWQDFTTRNSYVCGYLGLNPIFDYGNHFKASEIFHYDNIHVLDLTFSLDQLLTNLSAGRRRQLKDYEAVSSRFSMDKSILTDFFLANHVDFFKRKNAPDFYRLSDDTLSFIFSQPNILLVGAPGAEEVQTVAVFAYTPDVADYLFNISLPSDGRYSAALVWYGVNYLKSLKVPLLNLGGGSGGVGEFKRRFGGRTLALKCLKQVYRPDIYETLCRLTGSDPDEKTGYFPSYRGPQV
jgi:hypothetical protein